MSLFNFSRFIRVITISRQCGAARGTRRADSTPLKRPLKEIPTLIYKSPAGSKAVKLAEAALGPDHPTVQEYRAQFHW
jgi:hypothetical protein